LKLNKDDDKNENKNNDAKFINFYFINANLLDFLFNLKIASNMNLIKIYAY
jgi:hypothetical protein